MLATALPDEESEQRFLALYAASDGSTQAFWRKLRKDGQLGPHVDGIQFALQVGALTQSHAPLVEKLAALRAKGKIESVRDLARFDEQDWLRMLQAKNGAGPIGAPDAVPGKTDEERVANYAAALAHLVEDAFPTGAIAARVAADKAVPERGDLARFFEGNPGFELGRTPVDGYLAQHPAATKGLEDAPAAVTRLKSLERLSKLTPRYEQMRPLLHAGLDSALAISRLGGNRFAELYGEQMGSPLAARRVYDAASEVASTALMLVSKYAGVFNQPNPNVTPFQEVQAPGVPNWESLFGSIELCDCDQCRSVLSPAAYFTDILHFLAERPAVAAGKSAKDVLFERRPDLGEIELTCDNTNTPLPYVDLVDEVLENAIADPSFTVASGLVADLDAESVSQALQTAFDGRGFPLSRRAFVMVLQAGQRWHVVDTGIRYVVVKSGGSLAVTPAPQTSASADELGANPEHTNAAAYDVLRQAIFPWTLPFDLWIATARAYLEHLGVARADLMETFQTKVAPAPSALEIATEQLALSTLERTIVDGTHADWNAAPWHFWGYSAAGTWVNDLKKVRTLLDKAGLSYADLLELLKLKEINPAGTLTITSSDPNDPLTCDTEKLQIAALTQADLGRIVRFVRLWRALGWEARDLDKAITALRPASLDDDFLQTLAHVDELRRKLKLPVTRALGFYAPLDTAIYPDIELPLPKSLYEQLFQNPAVIKLPQGAPDPFALNPAHTELATVSDLVIAPADSQAVKDAKKVLRAALSAALGLSGADLVLLVDGPQAIVTADRKLSLENASRLARFAALSRALKLKTQDLLTVQALTGIDSFGDDTQPTTPAQTKATLDLVEKVATIRSSGFSIELLDYLLRNEVAPTSTIAPSEQAIGSLLAALRTGLQKIEADTTSQPDPVGQQLGNQLGTLGWDPGLVREVTDTLGGAALYSAPLAALPGGVVFPTTIAIAYDATAHTLQLTVPLTLAQRAMLLGLSANAAYQAAVQALFQAPRDFVVQQMKTFVDPTYTAPLAALPAGLRFPSDLSDRIAYDSDAAQLTFVGTMSAPAQGELLGLSVDAAYQAAVNALFNAPAAYVPPAGNAFLAAADAASLFDADRTAQSRYEEVLAKLDAYLRQSESEALVKQTLSSALKLDVALVDQLVTQWADVTPQPAHRAIQEFLDAGFVESSDKPTAASYPALFTAYRRLDKVARILILLDATSDELAWLLAHAGAIGWLDFATLPVAGGDPPAAFAAWERLVTLFAWREDLPETTPGALDQLGEALLFDPATGVPNTEKQALVEGWAALTSWPVEELETLLGQRGDATKTGLLGFRFPLNHGDPNDYADERTFLRLRDGFAMMKRTGASAQQAVAWAKPDLSADDARNVTQAAKSKYETSDWLQVAKPLRDVLRSKQRSALVDYLVAHPDPGKAQTWTDADGLYEYYLIDVQMTPCMLTSRIKQGISSTQLFTQRCLMNLESEVQANVAVDDKWDQWDWMSSYSVWAGAREIFLWPENWLEPELRDTDEKSPFFVEFENALLQNEVTADTAEEALRTYLARLDQVSQLEVVGVYHEVEQNSRGQALVDNVHVVARTRATPASYFYRRRENGVRWTPWESIDVDIQAPYVLLVVWNRRLRLFWPLFSEKQAKQTLTVPGAGGSVPEPPHHWEIQLAWSEYAHGKWQHKKIATPKESTSELFDQTQIYLRPFFEDVDLHVGLYLVVMMNGNVAETWNLCDFVFSGSHPGKVDLRSGWGGFLDTVPAGTGPSNMACVETIPAGQPWSPPGGGNELDLLVGTGTPTEVKTLGQTPVGVFSVKAQTFPQPTTSEPLFYADKLRSYFVTPARVSWWTGWGSDGFDPGLVDNIPWSDYYQEGPFTPDPLGPVEASADGGDPLPYELSAPILVASSGEAVADPARLVGFAGAGIEAETGDVLSAVTGVATTQLLEARVTNGNGRGGFANLAGAARPMAMGTGAGATLLSEPLQILSAQGAGGHALAYAKSAGRAYAVTGIGGARGIGGYWQRGTGFLFQPFYHPFVNAFVRELNLNRVDGLLQRPVQITPYLYAGTGQTTAFDFQSAYAPTVSVAKPYPTEALDWSYGGAYSVYNWELFFHAPLLIAERLRDNQRFNDAQKWFHYIFDPTDTSSDPAPRKFWRTGLFYDTTQSTYDAQQIQQLLDLLAAGSSDPDLAAQVAAWRDDPFDPHAIAAIRTTAYQKSVVKKYVELLIAWGDQLFRQDTIETINQATQLYVLAWQILGRKPEQIPPRALPPAYTYNALEPKLDDFSDALVEAEALVPPGNGGLPQQGPPVGLTLYFGVPQNAELLGLWGTIADRLTKIRTCRNIEGVVQQLPLFEPPVDPSMLVRAAAAGVDLSSALADVNAALPPYRFDTLAQKAAELCSETKALGAALLSALERRDAEALALLRSSNEISVLKAVHDVRQHQLDEAQQTYDTIVARQAVIDTRVQYYTGLIGGGRSDPENQQLSDLNTSKGFEIGAAVGQATAGVVHLLPDGKVGSPFSMGFTFGGTNVGTSINTFASAAASTASAFSTDAQKCAANATYDRRAAEWQVQLDLANAEATEAAKQLIVAQTRFDIASKELDNQDLQIGNAQAVDDLMRSKYTNQQLYDWMVGQISAVYFQSYQLAYDVAKRAERSFRHELGLRESSYILFGYWDSLKKGLLAAERLQYDLKRMEAAYLDQDRREFELTKTIPLSQLDPHALIELRQNGQCFVTLPEWLFDLDYPGHYMRRLKTVSLTVPCVAGPYTGLHCTLSYLGGTVRMDASTDGGYVRTGSDDPRFADSKGPVQQVATSHGQGDSGLFELNLRDPRYLPCEGQGLVESQWRIELDPTANRFDLDTISDVLVHVGFTARQGGDALKTGAQGALPQEGAMVFSARRDFADAWQRFLNPAADAQTQTLALDLSGRRFPYQPGAGALAIAKIDLYLKLASVPNAAPNLPVSLYANGTGTPPELLGGTPLASSPLLGGMYYASADLSGGPQATGDWLVSVAGADIPNFLANKVKVANVTYKHLKPEELEDLYVVCTFQPA